MGAGGAACWDLDLGVGRPRSVEGVGRRVLGNADRARQEAELGPGLKPLAGHAPLLKAVVQREDVVPPGLRPPEPDELDQLLHHRVVEVGDLAPLHQVVALARVLLDVVELPAIVAEAPGGAVLPGFPAVEGDRLPFAVDDGAVAEHLEVLRRVVRRRLGRVERVVHRHPLEGRLLHAVDDVWRLDSDGRQDLGHDIDHVVKLLPELSPGRGSPSASG